MELLWGVGVHEWGKRRRAGLATRPVSQELSWGEEVGSVVLFLEGLRLSDDEAGAAQTVFLTRRCLCCCSFFGNRLSLEDQISVTRETDIIDRSGYTFMRRRVLGRKDMGTGRRFPVRYC